MIKVSDLCMAYGKKNVLKNVSFEVKKGQTVGLLGANGAGKSSIMNILTGYISPKSGKVLIQDIDILKNPIEAKRQIGYLPEIPPLYKDMKVYEYLQFAAKLKGVKNYKEETNRIIALFDLEEKKYEYIKKLSKGMQQRVGFGFAFIGDPQILILDEPLVGLDPKESKKIRQVISEKGKDSAIIISSHILKEIDEVCNEILILKDGEIVLDNATSSAKKKNNNNIYRLVVKGKLEDITKQLEANDLIREVHFDKEVESGVYAFHVQTKNKRDVRDSLFGYLVGNKYNVYEIKKQESTLEDIFLNVTEKEAEK